MSNSKTPAERLVLTLCPFRQRKPGEPQPPHHLPPCETACRGCRAQAVQFADELATILEERHGGSSTTADWLRGLLLEAPEQAGPNATDC